MPATFPFRKTLIVSYTPLSWKLYLHVNSLSFESFHPGLRLFLHSLLKKFCQFTSFYLPMTDGWLAQVFHSVGGCACVCVSAVDWDSTMGENCFSWLPLALMQGGAQGPCPWSLEWPL